jgi:hypothetical protein
MVEVIHCGVEDLKGRSESEQRKVGSLIRIIGYAEVLSKIK